MSAWRRGDRVYPLRPSDSPFYGRRATVMRTVTLSGRELVEVLFDAPPRHQATEIVAFEPGQLVRVRREKRKRREPVAVVAVTESAVTETPHYFDPVLGAWEQP